MMGGREFFDAITKSMSEISVGDEHRKGEGSFPACGIIAGEMWESAWVPRKSGELTC